MKFNKASKRILAAIILLGLIGSSFAAGTWVQKNLGLGNVLRSLGTNYAAGTDNTYLPTVPLDEIQAMNAVGLPEELIGKLSLFVMAGQSNMSGKGTLPDIQHVNQHIYVFGNDYRWRLALEPIDSPLGQVDAVSLDQYARFSPALAFATELHRVEPDRIIGLIPCAKGETSIMQWQQNYSDQTLYGSCLKRTRAAQLYGTVDGIIFFQGEADTVDPGEAPFLPLAVENYAQMFEKYIADMRTDLDNLKLPVVFAQIGRNENSLKYRNWSVIQEQQESVQTGCTAMITTDDLELRDEVHYTTESYRTIGLRFAEAYHGLWGSPLCK